MSRTAHTWIASVACVAAGSAAAQLVASAGPTPAIDRMARLTVEAFADAPWVGRMSVHPEGDRVALGRVGPGSGTWYRVREMDTETGAVAERGVRTIPDPDSVAWDIDGSFAPPGSILVGGVHGIFAVSPTGAVSLAIPSSPWIDNPEDLRLDPRGDLIVASYSARALVRVDHRTGAQTPLQLFSAGILQFDVAADGSFRVIDPAGGVRAVGPDGENRGNAGSFDATGIAISPGGVWDEGVYTCDMRTGELLHIDDAGRVRTLFTDVFAPVPAEPGVVQPPAVELAFSPSGEMYIGVPDEGVVYRVSAGICFRIDTNGNGTITPADLNHWVWCFARGDMRADIDGDGMLLPADFYAWVNGYFACDRQSSDRAVRASQRLRQLGRRTR